MRRAARVDLAQEEIVKALRGVGATVLSLAAVGKGCPDLLVAFRDRNVLLEIKSPHKPPSERRLTKAEEEFLNTWAGPVYVVLTPEQAVTAVVGAARPVNDGVAG